MKNRNPQAYLVARLRGQYNVPVEDGAGPLNGRTTFSRNFPVAPIQIEAADTIERLLTERAWLPIELAPQDGSRILGYFPRAVASEGKRGVVAIIHRHDPGGRERNLRCNYETWIGDNGSPMYCAPPSHWMALPEFSATEESDTAGGEMSNDEAAAIVGELMPIGGTGRVYEALTRYVRAIYSTKDREIESARAECHLAQNALRKLTELASAAHVLNEAMFTEIAKVTDGGK